MRQVNDALLALGKDAKAVENCGMQDKKVYRSCPSLPKILHLITLTTAFRTSQAEYSPYPFP